MTMGRSTTMILVSLGVLAIAPMSVQATGFLNTRAHDAAALDAQALQEELRRATDSALGCGNHVGPERLAAIEQVLLPMWLPLPKNTQGRVDRRLLRYITNRYFVQTSALQIRGFEASRAVNHSGWGSADILSQRVPSYVEGVLESQHAEERGFDLQDAVHMVATVEELVFDGESALLEHVYKTQGRTPESPLVHADLRQVLEEYMVRWMMGDDKESIQVLLANRTLLEELFPHWHEIVGLVDGQITALQHQRRHGGPQTQAGKGRGGGNAFVAQYTIGDAHGVVGDITRSFAGWWESECEVLQTALVGMDAQHTGRVPLSKFHSAALGSEWRFGESAEYLRELGALDETSRWKGPQVIIPNYIQSASNCIVSTPHYMVCCINYCEGLLGEIESAIGAPMASAGEILAVVGNMTEQVSIDDDAAPLLQGSLTTQLEQIAAANSGKVPLHGRLFAQWLHYVFPRECPFPHKAGSVATTTPSEFGDKYIASAEEMKKHASVVEPVVAANASREEVHWMSQWSSDEELIADYAQELGGPWQGGSLRTAALLLGVIVAVGHYTGIAKGRPGEADPFTKAHFV